MAAAHDLSDSALGGPIQIHDSRLTDAFGRTLLLRGVNIGGASKLYVTTAHPDPLYLPTFIPHT